jgi:hypothetical protein
MVTPPAKPTKPIKHATLTPGPAFAIEGVISPSSEGGIGDRVCLYGLTTGKRCGEIKTPPQYVLDEAGKNDPNWRWVNQPSQGGDSGGPVVFFKEDGTALAAGITLGGFTRKNPVTKKTEYWSAYLDINAVKKSLGIQVSTII